MSRTLAIGLLLFVPALALRLTTGTPIPVWVVAGLIVLILMVFTWLVHRARQTHYGLLDHYLLAILDVEALLVVLGS